MNQTGVWEARCRRMAARKASPDKNLVSLHFYLIRLHRHDGRPAHGARAGKLEFSVVPGANEDAGSGIHHPFAQRGSTVGAAISTCVKLAAHVEEGDGIGPQVDPF